MKRLIPVFIIIIFSTLTSTYLLAATVLGEVKITEDGTCINIAGHPKPYKVISNSAEVSNALSKLRNGDFISGQGRHHLGSQSIVLNSIDYVGLKKILGHWVSKDQITYYFKDYENLHLSAPILNAPNKWTYRISPGLNDNWSVIFLDENSVKIGELDFKTPVENAPLQLQIIAVPQLISPG